MKEESYRTPFNTAYAFLTQNVSNVGNDVTEMGIKYFPEMLNLFGGKYRENPISQTHFFFDFGLYVCF
jgi:hypothetical protein